MKSGLLLHVPHSGTRIPRPWREGFLIDGAELEREKLLMTDRYTEDLFRAPGCPRLVFPWSRLVCDVERFRDPDREEMTGRGMWVCYERRHDLSPLKRVTPRQREEILRVYDAHHRRFTALVERELERAGRCLILDCHSYPSAALPYELHSGGIRPEVCLGTDDFHTPPELVRRVAEVFRTRGFTVAVNSPFAGTIVPLDFYGRERRVASLMVELRRDTYMDEATGRRIDRYPAVKGAVAAALEAMTGFLEGSVDFSVDCSAGV